MVLLRMEVRGEEWKRRVREGADVLMRAEGGASQKGGAEVPGSPWKSQKKGQEETIEKYITCREISWKRFFKAF